jgi:two-component system, NtrC family, response regulator HydG
MSSTGSILVIDDEKSIRVTLSEFLADEGYDVRAADSFHTAIELLDADTFDLLFVDILLGKESGIAVLRHVAKKGLGCLVVMMTGEPTIDTAAEALRLGAFDYMMKPVRQEAILRVAGQALRHKRLADEKDSLEKEKDLYRLNLDAIFKSVREAIITINTRMIVINANSAIEKFFPVTPHKMSGRHLYAFASESQKACLSIMETTLNTQEPFDEYAVEWISGTDGPMTVILNCAPFFDHTGAFAGAVLTIRQLPNMKQVALLRESRSGFDRIIGRSGKMQALYSLLEALASTDTTVLISGESGSGKELVAEALHNIGSRSGKPLVKVNCSALSEHLLESELFGHVKGAFTDAIKDTLGRFQMADGGTIFLDEIADIAPALQLKLLRVLQEKQFERVGDASPVSVDVRIIAATNQRLYTKMEAGTFREDLYYRIKVVEVLLPPLRERSEDIPLFIDHFIGLFNRKFGKTIRGVSQDVRKCFMAYRWPGNVRELQHALEHAFIKCTNPIISSEHLPPELLNPDTKNQYSETISNLSSSKEAILSTLKKTDWNVAKAARLLGMSRQHLYKKMKKLDIAIIRPG